MSGLPWFRLYAETIDDGKLRLLAYEDRWHFIAILCLKCSGDLEGKKEYRDRLIATKLGLSVSELDSVKKRLLEVDLIDDNFQPVAWDARQFKSDNSAERTRKYRIKKRSSDNSVTSQQRHGDGPDTDTDKKKGVSPVKKKAVSRFKKPSLQEIREYVSTRDIQIDAERFFDFYESNGWKVGRNSMKCWKSSVRTWEKRDDGSRPASKGALKSFHQRDIDETRDAVREFVGGP